MSLKKNHKKIITIIGLASFCGVIIYFLPIVYGKVSYNSTNTSPSDQSVKNQESTNVPAQGIDNTNSSVGNPIPPIVVTHIKTPDVVKAVYISAWTAGLKTARDRIIKLIDDTEVNAIVVDIKDATGRVSFKVSDPEIQKLGSPASRISNIRELTALLHSHNIYIIGRISVFQDPYLTQVKPEWAITKKSDGKVWKDHKGLSFLDPVNENVHKYIVAIAKEAYADGFDEINFDYIRYPSDGNIKDINYHIAAGRTRADNVETFFKYISGELKKGDLNIPMSADLFGLTTESVDDMGIGQVWEKALPYFDFLAPMIYPSHYPAGQYGLKNPAEHPYEVINHALIGAIKKTKAANQPITKIRPWLQDFNLGAKYTKELVQAQIKAGYDNGLTSWMLWDPNNRYTASALEVENKQ